MVKDSHQKRNWQRKQNNIIWIMIKFAGQVIKKSYIERGIKITLPMIQGE